MNKHDFRRIIRSVSCTGIALAAVGCATADPTAHALPDTAWQAQMRSIEASSGSGGNEQLPIAGTGAPTLAELKHFAVYQRFHGMVNGHANAVPGAQYSGSGAQSAQARSGNEQQLQQTDAPDMFSCLPSATVPQADTGK